MSPIVSAIGISLQNILLATDFSSCSEAALSYAVGLSRHYGSTLFTVNVVREELSDVQPPDPFYLRHTAERKMASLAQCDLFHGVTHRELLKEGEVLQVLLELIQRLGIDLAVLGIADAGESGNCCLVR